MCGDRSDEALAGAVSMTPIETDVLVIGSGAGGLSAAVTAAAKGLRVIVAEKANVLGGATAWSGGWMWIPRNPLARRAGINEERDAPRRYLQAVLGNRFDPVRIDAFLDSGPEMVAFFETQTSLTFDDGNTIQDIYGDLPDAGTGGRSIIARPIDGRKLGPLIDLVRAPMRETALWGMPIQAGADLRAFLTATRKPGSVVHVAKRIARHVYDLVRHGRAMQLVNGSALVARLVASGDNHGVTFMINAPATQLLVTKGRVTGAVLLHGGQSLTLRAKRGVVVATGGFSNDAPRCASLFPHSGDGSLHWSLPPTSVSGDGVRLVEAVGGVLETDVENAGAWCPVSLVPHADGTMGHFPHIVDRGKPGLIAVRADGKRFVNEADGYHDYIRALFTATMPGDAAESWLIADAKFVALYGLGFVKPWPFRTKTWIKRGYLKRASTLTGLARDCRIDATELQKTVEDFNANAERGQDPEFHRGATAYNRYQGDPDVGPNQTLGPIKTAPYYAVKVIPGSFGTFAGIRTDAKSRPLDAKGEPIPGLHVVGSDMASIMGGHYPAGGINLGPAMVFGFIAGCNIVEQAGAIS
jgi:succinate dehydrogenase/fumarate reductase flavoprotein subunit